MYWIATTMRFYNGMQFDSLAEALAKARKLTELHPGIAIDVMALVDAKHTRVVRTNDSAPQGITRLKSKYSS